MIPEGLVQVQSPSTATATAMDPMKTGYVGNLSPTCSNDHIESILGVCGRVARFKRMTDPSSGTLKSFGFCEFETGDGLLRSFRLLNGMSLGGRSLLVQIEKVLN